MHAFGRLAAAICGVAAIGASKPDEGRVDYRLTPELNHGRLSDLQITLSLHADASGRTRLELPDQSMGEQERWRRLSGFVARGARLEDDGPAHRILISKPHAAVTVTYRVASAYDADPSGNGGNPYKGPIVRPAWFSALGDYVFVTVEGRDYAPASFHWGVVPKGWTVASNLDGRGDLAVEDVSNSTLIGGSDVQVMARPIGGGSLHVAIRGDWPFDRAAFADELAAILTAQRKFWGGSNAPYFVSLTPLAASGGMSVGGTGRSEGFALYATANAPDTVLRHTLAHEHTHNWIPMMLGRIPDGAEEPSAYWFSEGFTDFYTDRTLLRSGQWTPADFLERLNTVLREYDTSSLRTAPNAVIVSDFWKSEAAQRLPYQRGYLLAFLWDDKMHRATHGARGLDDVMFAMRDAYRAAPAAAKPLAVDSFQATARRLTGVDVVTDVAAFVTQGHAIVLPADLFKDCAVINEQTVPAYDLGFDAKASAAKGVFTGVDPAGPAYKAGLRDGMKRIAREGGSPGDSRVALTYQAADETGTTKVIRYKPEGRSTVSFRQAAWASGAATPADACFEILGGARLPETSVRQ